MDGLKKLDEIFEIDNKGLHNDAMKMLYSEIYDILAKQDMKKCELYLSRFLELSFSIELQVAFARITKPFKEKINNRDKLLSVLKHNLQKECPEREAESVFSHVA